MACLVVKNIMKNTIITCYPLIANSIQGNRGTWRSIIICTKSKACQFQQAWEWERIFSRRSWKREYISVNIHEHCAHQECQMTEEISQASEATQSKVLEHSISSDLTGPIDQPLHHLDTSAKKSVVLTKNTRDCQMTEETSLASASEAMVSDISDHWITSDPTGPVAVHQLREIKIESCIGTVEM